jgi:Domain of unknown function (DUF4160)
VPTIYFAGKGSWSIVMYGAPREHPPAHFHAISHDKREYKYNLPDLEVKGEKHGGLTAAEDRAVRAWAGEHLDDLQRCFDLVMAGQHPGKIS